MKLSCVYTTVWYIFLWNFIVSVMIFLVRKQFLLKYYLKVHFYLRRNPVIMAFILTMKLCSCDPRAIVIHIHMASSAYWCKYILNSNSTGKCNTTDGTNNTADCQFKPTQTHTVFCCRAPTVSIIKFQICMQVCRPIRLL